MNFGMGICMTNEIYYTPTYYFNFTGCMNFIKKNIVNG